MSHTKNPNQILKNLRDLIDETETALSRGNRQHLADEQLNELKHRFQTGFNRLRGESAKAAERIKHETGAKVREYYDEFEDRFRTGAEMTVENVRAHPYRTAFILGSIALVAGGIVARYIRSS